MYIGKHTSRHNKLRDSFLRNCRIVFHLTHCHFFNDDILHSHSECHLDN